MPLFKKSNTPLTPFRRTLSLGIPTHIAIGPVGFGADLDPEIDTEGVFRSAQSSVRWC